MEEKTAKLIVRIYALAIVLLCGVFAFLFIQESSTYIECFAPPCPNLSSTARSVYFYGGIALFVASIVLAVFLWLMKGGRASRYAAAITLLVPGLWFLRVTGSAVLSMMRFPSTFSWDQFAVLLLFIAVLFTGAYLFGFHNAIKALFEKTPVSAAPQPSTAQPAAAQLSKQPPAQPAAPAQPPVNPFEKPPEVKS